jgi:hypothetical protein
MTLNSGELKQKVGANEICANPDSVATKQTRHFTHASRDESSRLESYGCLGGFGCMKMIFLLFAALLINFLEARGADDCDNDPKKVTVVQLSSPPTSPGSPVATVGFCETSDNPSNVDLLSMPFT